MNESQVRVVVVVADAGGFAAAAARLHMSQPGVSRAVRSLEAELGADLFRRHHGGVELTAFGERALVRCRAVLAEFEALRQERAGDSHGLRGRVRLGSMPSVSQTVLPALLTRVAHRWPRLLVTVVDGHDDELLDWLQAGIVDIAVVAGTPTGLSLQPFVTDRLEAVLPASHPLAARATIRAKDLDGLPFILTRAGCERLILAALAERGVAPNVVHEVSEAGSILAMVRENLGVSVMPSLAARRPPPGVVLRPLTPAARRPLSLALTPRRAPTPAARAFLDESAKSPRAARRTSGTRRP